MSTHLYVYSISNFKLKLERILIYLVECFSISRKMIQLWLPADINVLISKDKQESEVHNGSPTPTTETPGFLESSLNNIDPIGTFWISAY